MSVRLRVLPCLRLRLFVFPNCPQETISIGWSELRRLRVTDRSSVATVMALSLYVNLPALAAASPSVSLIQSGCLRPAHSSIVWVSLLLFSVFTHICLRMFRLKNPSDGGVFTVSSRDSSIPRRRSWKSAFQLHREVGAGGLPGSPPPPSGCARLRFGRG